MKGNKAVLMKFLSTQAQKLAGEDNVFVDKSAIEGQGLFAGKGFKKGEVIGLAHQQGQPVGLTGNFHNHATSPNAVSVKQGDSRFLVAAKNLPAGTEITSDYRMQPELEQPSANWMQRGGLTLQPYYTPAAESTGANYTPTMTVQAAEKLKAQRDAQELARRKQAIQASQAAASKPLRKRLTPENLAQETGATGDKLRFFPDDPDSFIDEYLNPLKMIGDMASGLGRIPLNVKQGNYGQAAMSVATPLVVGATAGLGAKTAGQFVNNLANPLAGTGQFLTTKTPLKNAYKYNPWAFKPKPNMYYRQVGEPGYLNAIQENRVLAKGQKEFLEQNPGFNYWDDYDKLTGYKNKTGFFSLEKPKVAPFFQKGELFFPISNRTGFGRGKTAASDVKYLFEGNLPDEAILPRYRDSYLTREQFLGDYTGGTGVLDPKYSDLSNFKIYKQDWLRGYKPIEVPKTSMISDLNEIFKNFNPKNLKTQSGTDWMKSWYSDPDFLRRYNIDPYYHSQDLQEHVLNQLEKYQPKNYIDLLKDKGFGEYLNKSTTSGGVSWGVPESIYTNRTMYAPFNRKGLESVRAHELTHLIENNGRLLSSADEKRLLQPFGFSSTTEIPKNPGFFKREILGNNPEYYLDPTEIHARMNQARFDLGLTPKDKFSEKMFDKISKNKDWYGMGKYIKDKKGFVDLMNNFWAVPPAVIGAAALQGEEEIPKQKKGGVIKDDRGQWAHPGEITEIGNVGFFDMTNPNIYKASAPISIGLGTSAAQEYQKGGQHGGLDRWFAEKWVDVKTGKECGRQEGEKRAGYPACRPSKRISEDTPKTASELSSSEKEKFKRSKTSSERISYQHKRKQDGGEWLDKYDEGGAIYTVKKGDTLSKIAAENKTTVNKIVQANNIKNPNIIGIDQKLVIPQSSSINNAQTGSTQYVDWSEKKKNLDRLNSLPDEQLITGFYSDKPEQTYLVVDKKNAQMKVYKGDKVVKTYEVGVGANPGDAQTVTKMVNGKTDWGAGNRSTGAGVYTISNIDPASKAYYGLPSFNLKNDRGIEVATTIHGTPIGRRSRFDNDNVEDNRMSYGCINGKCFDLKDLQQHVDIETPVYILPEDEGNRFQIVDGKPVLKVSAQNRNKYNSYIDTRGNVQKGQGANQSVNTLSYKPIQAVFDENKFKEKVFTWNDLNDEKEYEQTTKPFYKALVKNKQSIMKTAKIPSDVYNELAQMAFGIYGTESNFGDTHSAAGNLARAAVKFLDSKNSSSPDYTSKATTYGANEDFRSVGLTQVRWNYLNEDEKRVLKSLGITSNMDFMDPEKAAIGTVALLGVRYNQQLTSDQKRDVWAHLPSKWNRRKNYGDRVKQNASYLNFKEATNKRQTGGQTNWLDNYTD